MDECRAPEEAGSVTGQMAKALIWLLSRQSAESAQSVTKTPSMRGAISPWKHVADTWSSMRQRWTKRTGSITLDLGKPTD